MTRSRAPSIAAALPLLVRLVALLAFATLATASDGCSRSSLQGELEGPPGTGSPCGSSADCPAGTTCDPASQECVVADGGSDDGGCTANTNVNLENCGACGNVCPPSYSCLQGTCAPPSTTCELSGCAIGESCCAEGCIDTEGDPNNCGGCSVLCANGESCFDGQCGTPFSDGGGGCATEGCVQGQTCCASGCVNPGTDTNDCGGCGLVCPAGTTSCFEGQCCTNAGCGAPPTCNCQVGQSCCTTGCEDTATDPHNCGGCGDVCTNGGSCVGGICTTSCAGGPACSAAESCCASGCSNVASDPSNCGTCGTVCTAGDACIGGSCKLQCGDAGSCAAGQSCCASGCASTMSDPANCGGCNIQCGATALCVDGSCVANEGAFDPIVNPTYLAPGVHNFTTINVPAGVTVYVAGAGPLSGTLDLHATGAIEIDGTIDLSGGPGTQNTITSQSTESGRAGGGGFTGEPYATAALSAACQFVAGNPGSLGLAISGTAGNCPVGSTTVCNVASSPSAEIFASPPAAYGGGAGVFTGYRAYGSGGGGAAGGAPGAAGTAYAGEPDCSGASGGGGAVNGAGGFGGGNPYDGTAGVLGQTQCTGVNGAPAAYVGGGGGGSIGTTAVADLAVATTFQTGSAGGGASADYLNRPVFGGTSGGGGGGGALKLETVATINVTGQLLANGGPGGDSVIGTAAPNCDPQPGAGGGGGSGGVIYLSAPAVTISSSAVISAAGGPGGAQSEFASGGGGGAGGIGRIRLSVTQASCTLSGSFDPPLASACLPTPGGASGSTFVGTYPN